MRESVSTEQLVLHWVPVVDAAGETRLEAHWSAGTATVAGHAA